MKLGYKLIIFIGVLMLINSAVTLTMALSNAGTTAIIIAEIAISVLSVLIGAFYIKHALTVPLEKLERSIKGYKKGKLPHTDRKDEIGRLQNGFSQLTEQLDGEKAKQNRIIASISHDIKTPLTSVMGYTEFLKNPNLPEVRREKYRQTIYAKAKEIEGIVIEFDDYLSCNLDFNLNRDFITVSTLLTEMAEEMRTEVLYDGMTILFFGSSCDDSIVYADKAKLHRVFMNVVTNATKHAGVEKLVITFTAELRSTGLESDEIVFRITDNGKGVKPEELSKIFEPMYTTDRSRSVAGLGLAICSEIIEAHNGTIWAESEYGHSFSICFTLKTARIQL